MLRNLQMYPLKRSLVSLNQLLGTRFRRNLTSQPETSSLEATEKKNIVVERYNGVTTIGIDRREKKNAVNVATAEQLSIALDEFDKDTDSTVCVLHGIGGNFCAGYDLIELANYDGEDETKIPHFSSLASRHPLCSKLSIAVLSGYTLGFGLELALMCDLRMVETTALIGFPNRRFDIPILSGGTARLSALIGYSRAMDLILTGRLIKSKEAFDWGLVNRTSACGSGLGAAVNLAFSLSQLPCRAMLADRASAYYATFCSKQIEDSLQFERDNASHLLYEQAVNGAKLFAEEGRGKHGKFYNKVNDKYLSLGEILNLIAVTLKFPRFRHTFTLFFTGAMEIENRFLKDMKEY
ncbi:probable enoyl-CoA hydratase echA8 [Prorops nasuta]|uniref:probable enoyl-CoA hydratase echA8 n=1 Tax=Prorops nasuta TaxID=863751 RepID=UPI0034CEDC28